MIGIVFTAFLEHVEERHGIEVADRILVSTDSVTGGAYTAGGAYDHRELVQLVDNLAGELHEAPREIQRRFGRHLLGVFAARYPDFFADFDDPLELLVSASEILREEVVVLHSSADLPDVEPYRFGSGRLELVYRSPVRLADLAEGMIEGCAAHYASTVRVTREERSRTEERVVSFLLEAA